MDMSERDSTLQTAAGHFIEGLNDLGIEYLFCNLGTDHAPLIEEMTRRRQLGLPLPKTVLCPHENTAVHMAAGYALATGRGQGVMVHVDAGTANAAMGMHNLFRSRIPVLLMAGSAPYTVHGELPGTRDSYVNFVQEPYDQASVVRPYVKWEYNLPSGVVARQALTRAHNMMQSDPQGPVYLMFARETLTEQIAGASVRSGAPSRHVPVMSRGLDPEIVDVLAARLLAAERPLLMTSYAGRRHEAVRVIDELARFAGIRVIESNPHAVNIPHDSPCFAGFLPGQHLAEADVGLLVDVDVPWIPADVSEDPATWWAHIDCDADKRGFPTYGFPADLRLQADSSRVLAQLLDALRARADDAFRARAAARVDALAQEHAARARAAAQAASDPGTSGAINPAFMCAALQRVLAPDDVVLNEAIRNGPTVLAQMPRTRAGSLVGLSGGGLGFSAGTALGIKLAHPHRTVVNIVGDGTFYFGNPQSTLAVSKQYRLPVFTVVLVNSGWAAVKAATLRVYPDGQAKALGAFEAELAPDIDFAMIAQAAGAHGERIEDPAQLEAAIARCLQAVREQQRSAVLHVRVTKL